MPGCLRHVGRHRGPGGPRGFQVRRRVARLALQDRGQDQDAVREMHAALSPENAYLRFFSLSPLNAEREAQRVPGLSAEITPQPIRHEEPNQPAPLPTTDSKQTGYYYTTEIQPEVSDSSIQHPVHVRNFLDCVKSRNKPNADIELAHATNTVCRLGTIAYRVGRTLHWDAGKEQIVGDTEAQRLAVGTYRDPWKPKGL